jgi:uncharacterized protein (UPF0332 family)
MSNHEQEIAANLERAERSIAAAKELFELRNVGDYGVTVHVSQPEAERAIQMAADFLHIIRSVLRRD